ncbi:restriction endonuclease, partial [Yersinia pestis]
MFNDKNLDSFLDQFNYDLRISGNARWIDQKCTPDVVCIIADCILNHVEFLENIEFSTKDIWDSQYAKEVSDLFSKPDIHSENAQNEYDKFFQQPMELLAYSGILSKEKKGLRNIYSVKNIELLSYIAVRERNALKFLTHYIKHVLNDSNLYADFENFFDNPNVNSFSDLKSAFENFTIKYTSINTKVECRRIFTKILNPLAFDVKSYG